MEVEQVIYSFGDAKLPTPVTVTQLLWLVASGALVFVFRKVPPLAFVHNPLILCCIPFGVTWFMSKKDLWRQETVQFCVLGDRLCAALEVTFAGKPVRLKKAPRERGYYRSEEWDYPCRIPLNISKITSFGTLRRVFCLLRIDSVQLFVPVAGTERRGAWRFPAVDRAEPWR